MTYTRAQVAGIIQDWLTLFVRHNGPGHLPAYVVIGEDIWSHLEGGTPDAYHFQAGTLGVVRVLGGAGITFGWRGHTQVPVDTYHPDLKEF